MKRVGWCVVVGLTVTDQGLDDLTTAQSVHHYYRVTFQPLARVKVRADTCNDVLVYTICSVYTARHTCLSHRSDLDLNQSKTRTKIQSPAPSSPSSPLQRWKSKV